jgi:hypothetical protein
MILPTQHTQHTPSPAYSSRHTFTHTHTQSTPYQHHQKTTIQETRFPGQLRISTTRKQHAKTQMLCLPFHYLLFSIYSVFLYSHFFLFFTFCFVINPITISTFTLHVLFLSICMRTHQCLNITDNKCSSRTLRHILT